MYSTKMRGKNKEVRQYGIQERGLHKMVPRMLGKLSPRMTTEQHALKSIQLEQRMEGSRRDVSKGNRNRTDRLSAVTNVERRKV